MEPTSNNNELVDLEQYKYEQSDKELREQLTEFSQSHLIQVQLGEAFYIWKNNPELLSEDIVLNEIDQTTFTKFYDWFLFDFKLFNSGITVIRSYYEEKNKSLSLIERRILKDWINSICSFYILKDVDIDGTCEIQDIFSNGTFRVIDKSTAEKVKPMTILCARMLKVGKFNYFSDIITLYPYSFYTLILDFFKSEYIEYEKTFKKDISYGNFLKDWGYLIFQYLDNISSKAKFVTPDGSEFTFSVAEYNVINFDKTVKLLNSSKNFRSVHTKTGDIHTYTVSLDNSHDIQGFVELDKSTLTLECYSKLIFNKAMKNIDKEIKDNVTFEKNYTRNLKSTLNKEGNYKPLFLPPGVNNRNEMDNILESYYEEWLHKTQDYLNGMTPLNASKSPESLDLLKLALTELEQLYESAKERGEPYYDISKLRAKLNIE